MEGIEKYKELLEVNHAVIFQLSVDGVFTSLDKKWEQLTGLKVSETLETPVVDYIYEDDKRTFLDILKVLVEAQRDGIHHEIRFYVNGKDVENTHLFIKGNYDDHQKVASFSGTIASLSSRVMDVDDFRENFENYRLISEHMNDLVSVLAADGLVLYASPSHTTILGRNLDDYVGSYPIQHIHPDDQERVFHFFVKMVEKWSTLEIEYRCLHNNGEWRDLEMKCTPMKGPKGDLQIVSVSRDITVRKRAEEELRQTTNKLETLIASLPYGVLVVDANGMITLFNNAFLDIFFRGQKKESMSEEERENIIQKSYDIFENHHDLNTKTNEITKNRLNYPSEEMEISDGRVVEREGIPIIEAERFDGYLWIFRDVTEKKRSEKKLKEANEILQKLSMIDGLTGIPNRRSFDIALQKEWERLTDLSEPLSLLLFDIDYFKSFNDIYGHQAGDACLKEIGQILNNFPLHPHDIAARYGGEEFVILLPGKSEQQAFEIASEIQEEVKKKQIPHKGANHSEYLTLSIGISTLIATTLEKPEKLVEEADKALYEAKRNGRNQIRAYVQR
ncbi:diguanylate cyclase domain-containing protein [Metabacillus malikii]|uniref:Diguanylate cyclase (GGDEF)-like protein/PAS domain S-box-containing protein n=1 Tax=Metabacillus malikii TaxID=1504265 RepID=A0ABT9ZA20_9BACI|nr:diguanylate cyclase [Metabacillus malikii]MDQ0229096.1 diguanylate cyclase (GGDEF)-like protein/PAS domain S-box-containing protein [Metabacillus malikii]